MCTKVNSTVSLHENYLVLFTHVVDFNFFAFDANLLLFGALLGSSSRFLQVFFRYCLFFINFVLIISSHKLRFTRNRQETNTLILSFKLFCRKNLQSKNPICITRNLESFELKRCSILSYKLQNTSCSATHVYYFLKPLNKVNCVIL